MLISRAPEDRVVGVEAGQLALDELRPGEVAAPDVETDEAGALVLVRLQQLRQARVVELGEAQFGQARRGGGHRRIAS
ncbi:MAG: hypothetical protein GX596_04665 [Propionibacterium sp.]|nr:hypothetical protein [Propionibacterium sp.]